MGAVRLSDGRHLTYCTNVHPGESGDETLAILREEVPAVRRALGHEGPLGVGLRVSDAASRAWASDAALERVRAVLADTDQYVFTLNGFPYGRFHGSAVKDRVYLPDWTQPARLAYTARLARLLAALGPPDGEGSISTCPVGYRGHHADRATALDAAARALGALTQELQALEAETGQWIHVDLEPEPDGLLETVPELVGFFTEHLLRAGRDHLAARAGIPGALAEAWLRRHVGLCLDVCHAAVLGDPILAGLAALRAEGLQLGKVQLSAALEAEWPDARARGAALQALAPFDEATYLHQVAVTEPSGATRRLPDLGEALRAELPDTATLRTHFHVPLFLSDYGVLRSTQAAVEEVLAADLPCRHLEVETYTFDVLPEGLRIDRTASIARELSWILEHR